MNVRRKREELKLVRTARAVDKKKRCARLAVENKARLQGLKEQKEIGRFLLPDAPERKQKRKPSPPRISCPLIPGTPETLPPRKKRHWEVEVDPGLSTSAADDVVPPQVHCDIPMRACRSTVSKAAVEVTPTTTGRGRGKGKRKATPTKLVISPSTGVQAAEEVNTIASVADADFQIVVDAEINVIGFTPTSSPADLMFSTVVSSPTASTMSRSAVTNEPSMFEDVEEEMEQSVVENPGSDMEGDLQDMDMNAVIDNVAEYPAEFGDPKSDLMDEINAHDARDDSALRQFVGSEEMLGFSWQTNPNLFTGEREVFSGPSGPTFETKGLTPLDIFERIWDDTIIDLMVTETNRYAHHFKTSNQLQHARIKKWKDIQTPDLWSFLAILMVQSLTPNPVEKDYWIPRFPYLRTGNLTDIMVFDKFTLMKKYLHFADNTVTPAYSKLAKISPIIEHLNRKFSSLYLPEQNIVIGDSLLPWKGKLNFVQRFSNKAAQVGIKCYELCESRTGYLWKFEIYAGKGRHLDEGHDVDRGANEPEGATSQIVYRLMRPLLNKGHTLVMDKFYNSPLLSRSLKAQKTDTLGALRLNRQFVPNYLLNKTKTYMPPGEIVFSYTNDLSITVWKDSNLVSLISTYHKVEVSEAEKYGAYKYKPKVVLDYNLSMEGVDKKNQLLKAFPVERIFNLVWYKKLFRRLLNVSIYNSYIMYRHTKKIPHREFRMMLANQILKKHSPPLVSQAPLMIVGHYPIKSTPHARCRQCYKTKTDSRTSWACDGCGVRLCIPCFRKYHSEN